MKETRITGRIGTLLRVLAWFYTYQKWSQRSMTGR